MELTDRDKEIIDTLTRRVSCMSLDQVATWWDHSANSRSLCKRRIKRLEGAQLVESAELLVATPPAPDSPILRWEPGDEQPDFGAIAWKAELQSRTSPTPTTIVIATAHAAARFGGAGGRMPRAVELNHDVGLAQTFLHFRAIDPRASTWVSEAELKRRGGGSDGEPLPDALVYENETPVVIEYVGKYSRARLERHHEHMAARRMIYELWGPT